METFPIEEPEDGIYVGLPPQETHINTVRDLMMETLINWGVKQVFGMVGHSNLGVADALRIQEKGGRLSYYGIRQEGVAAFACSGYGKLTGLWDANVNREPVATQMLDSAYSARLKKKKSFWKCKPVAGIRAIFCCASESPQNLRSLMQ